jgi:hypothetical protein
MTVGLVTVPTSSASTNPMAVHENSSNPGSLYYLDMAKTEKHTVLAVSTVESNKSKYADRDYSRAILARKIQVLVGQPELKDFIRYIKIKALTNCPITRQDKTP